MLVVPTEDWQYPDQMKKKTSAICCYKNKFSDILIPKNNIFSTLLIVLKSLKIRHANIFEILIPAVALHTFRLIRLCIWLDIPKSN